MRRVVLIIGQALLLIIVAEVTARLIWDCRPNQVFIRETVNGQSIWRLNKAFYQRFFNLTLDQMVEWEDLETIINVQNNDPNSLRVVVLGGSAAFGAPP